MFSKAQLKGATSAYDRSLDFFLSLLLSKNPNLLTND